MTIRKVAVVGCGTMGRGVVEACAAAGVEVTAIKVTPGDSAATLRKIREALQRRVSRGKLTAAQADQTLARISVTDDLRRVGDADIVIESVVESFEIKRNVLLSAEKVMHVGALLATNLEWLVHQLENLTGTRFLDAKVYFMSDLPAHVQLGDVVQVAAVALLLCLLATLYPAWRASRVLPAEALRHD